jgi:membrane-bound lytic murein transglycosylase A
MDRPGSAATLDPSLVETAFGAIPGWGADDHAAALAAFSASCRRMIARPYSTKSLGVDAGALARLAPLALEALKGATAPRRFFEENFRPFRFADDISGFVTGYYEPVVAASLERTGRFAVPLYRRPHDLVDVAPGENIPGLPADFRFARAGPDGISQYFDRAAIEDGALAGRGLELAWLEDPVDAFLIHIQGSARLSLPDGRQMRVSYDGKSGHPFTPVGRILIERGELHREDVTMDAIRAWMRRDASAARELMRLNRSFIFFQQTSAAPGEGPVAAASVPLTPGRSLAIDHRLHSFGTPVFVATAEPVAGDPWERLMIAQDTGSAIIGPQRGDLFIGSGDAAGSIAGAVRHAARFFLLVPLAQAERLP